MPVVALSQRSTVKMFMVSVGTELLIGGAEGACAHVMRAFAG